MIAAILGVRFVTGKRVPSYRNTGAEQTHSTSLDAVLDCQRITLLPKCKLKC